VNISHTLLINIKCMFKGKVTLLSSYKGSFKDRQSGDERPYYNCTVLAGSSVIKLKIKDEAIFDRISNLAGNSSVTLGISLNVYEGKMSAYVVELF